MHGYTKALKWTKYDFGRRYRVIHAVMMLAIAPK
jgi:hypothetical protein